MFARWSRLAFRRCLHTRASPAAHYNRLSLVLGLSAATATYITWHLSTEVNRIALDSPHNAGKLSKPTRTPKSEPEPELQPSSTVTEPQSTEEKDATSQDEEGATTSGGGGAFNPETGEINWDCPCLGGMAHGPCGLQFREAFSCFVFSEAEPKGMDCIEKFKAMQDCFREHPDVYADEIMDDDEAEGTSTPGEQSSTATAIAENTKDEAPTAPPPNPSLGDFPPNTPTSTASS